MHFGATLQLLRSHAGVSLRSLGSRVGVSAAYLSRVEHGHDPIPTSERAIAIAEALGLPPPLLLGLVDELRGDAADWLRASSTGRRLSAELRRRRLNEAQLARVLAFVVEEFPAPVGATRGSIRPLLTPSRVLPGVRLSQLDDAWTLAALRLVEGDGVRGLVGTLRAGVDGGTACVGHGTAVGFVRGHAAEPRACVVICGDALAVATPDGQPIHVVWVLAGVGASAVGAEILASAARLADVALVRALVEATSPEEALQRVERFERGGVP